MGAMSGTTPEYTSAGVATFSDLSINSLEYGYGDYLIASCGSATGYSNGFAVLYAPAVTSVIPPTVNLTTHQRTITVNGSSFYGLNPSSDVSSVTIGGVVATSYAVLSDTQLTAIVPAGNASSTPPGITGEAGVYDIVVTTSAGQSATSTADEFTVNPLPVVTGVSPTTVAEYNAPATTVTVNGTGFLGGHAATDSGLTVVATFDNVSHPIVTLGVVTDGLSVTDNSLTFIVAPGSLGITGSYDVQVTVQYSGPADPSEVLASTAAVTSASSSADLINVAWKPTIAVLTPNSVPIGAAPQTITVNGGGFYGGGTSSDVLSVTVGGTAVVNFDVISNTQLTATIPSSITGLCSGDYLVVITTTGGTSIPVNNDVIIRRNSPNPTTSLFYVTPTPVVTGVAPSTIPESRATDGGTLITVDGSGFLGGHAATDAGLTITATINNVTYNIVTSGVLQSDAIAADTQLSFTIPDSPDLTSSSDSP